MRMKMKAFHRSGDNGSYIEFSDGTYIDTVAGDTYFASRTPVPESNQEVDPLVEWVNNTPSVEWVDELPASDGTAAEIEEYVGV